MSHKPEGSIKYIPPEKGWREGKFISKEPTKTTYTSEERAEIEAQHPNQVVTWYEDETGEGFLVRDKEVGE